MTWIAQGERLGCIKKCQEAKQITEGADMLWNAKNGAVPFDHAVMNYVSFGQGSKTLIIFPGLSDGLTTVKGKALLLAAPYRMFFEKYTVYMFSRKDPLPSGYSIRDMAEDQEKAMHKLGIRKAAVMGVSQGGMIAQSLAAFHPELVEKLIIAVSALCVNERIRGNITRWIAYAKAGDHNKLMIDTAEKSYSETYLKRYRKLYPLMGMIGKPKHYGSFLANAEAILKFDLYDDLGRITCPVLILGGTRDKIVGIEASREIHEHISGSLLYEYEGLGHAAYEEAKDFNQRVYGFLEG